MAAGAFPRILYLELEGHSGDLRGNVPSLQVVMTFMEVPIMYSGKRESIRFLFPGEYTYTYFAYMDDEVEIHRLAKYLLPKAE